MNSSITNSKSAFRRYVIGLVGLLALSLAIPYGVYRLKPSLFYFRAFEYFDEVVYPDPNADRVWTGLEKGESSRKYYFRFQETRYTRVTTDPDGFRSVPYPSDRYQILVCGDSQNWGSGLSDDETLPWRLAEGLHMAVFNGGRPSVKLEQLLARPDLHHVKLIIHVMAGHNVRDQAYFPDILGPARYMPIRTIDAKPLSVRRFYPGAMAVRAVNGMLYDAAELARLSGRKNEYICPSVFRLNGFTQETLSTQAAMITRFSRQLGRLGYTYMLVLVPPKCLFYSESADGCSAQYFPELIARLRENGVHAVDLIPSFGKNRDLGLFFRADSHWTPRATDIAAADVAEYLRTNRLVDDVKDVQQAMVH